MVIWLIWWANSWKSDVSLSDFSEQFVEYIEVVLAHSSFTNPYEIPPVSYFWGDVRGSILGENDTAIGML